MEMVSPKWNRILLILYIKTAFTHIDYRLASRHDVSMSYVLVESVGGEKSVENAAVGT
jgi:hypothetical protein